MINKIFKNRYERELFLKSFLLYFFSIIFLILVIFYFHYKNILSEQKQLLYLEMKNFALSFEGKKFNLDLTPLKKNQKVPFYELLENDKEFYMYIPIPDVKTDVLKITYLKQNFFKEIKPTIEKLYFLYLLVLIIVVVLSLLFAIYTTNPLRKAINLLNETIKDIIHDINTPVMSIIINLKLLKLKYNDDEDLQRLEVAVKQLSSIYKNLRAVLEEARKNLDEFNLKQVIEDELKTLQSLYPDISIDKKMEDVIIIANKEAVERVIFNILSNAFKHNINQGFVRVFLTKKKLIVENSSKEIKNPDKLFDRYYKESQRGVGLGLDIIKKLVDELGWKIQIKSEKDRFTVILLLR